VRILKMLRQSGCVGCVREATFIDAPIGAVSLALGNAQEVFTEFCVASRHIVEVEDE
jgi:hypothetical protein